MTARHPSSLKRIASTMPGRRPRGRDQRMIAAIGVLSGTSHDGVKYRVRRAAARQTWGEALERQWVPAAVRFVLRCGGLPVDAPERSEPGVLCTDVPAVLGRRMGPVRSLMAWLSHAIATFPNAHFIGKADDDVYLHPPAIIRLLESVPVGMRKHAYLGYHNWYHTLYEPGRQFQFTTYSPQRGYSNMAARRTGLAKRCSVPNVTCHGPFPYACGPFFAIGRRLVQALAANEGIRAEMDSLSVLPMPAKEFVVEDVWLGSVLWRHVGSRCAVPPEHPYADLPPHHRPNATCRGRVSSGPTRASHRRAGYRSRC